MPVLMHDTSGQWSVTGPAVDVSDKLMHTISVEVANFRGRIYLEGAVAQEPTDADWFEISISDDGYLDYPRSQASTMTMSGGESSTIGLTIKFNLTWLRARVDRSHLNPPPPAERAAYGNVIAILTR